MSKSLPNRPNLEHIKNEAKALLKAHKHGDPGVYGTLRHLARLRDAPDREILAATVSLQEVQHALACEYGLKSWEALTNLVAQGTEFAAHVQEKTRRTRPCRVALGYATPETTKKPACSVGETARTPQGLCVQQGDR